MHYYAELISHMIMDYIILFYFSLKRIIDLVSTCIGSYLPARMST